MSISWNTAGDFSAVVDTLEAVTLLRQNSSAEIPIPKAWRFSEQIAESQPAGGAVRAGDAVWQFEWPDTEPPPQLGDRLVDTAGEYWTVRVVEQLQGSSRWRVAARNLRIAQGLDHLVNIEQAVWDDEGSGPEIVGWTTLYPAVRARVQPLEVVVDHESDPVTSTADFRILLEESLPLDHNHRFVDGDGHVYQLLRYEFAERIDTLSVATVRRLD